MTTSSGNRYQSKFIKLAQIRQYHSYLIRIDAGSGRNTAGVMVLVHQLPDPLGIRPVFREGLFHGLFQVFLTIGSAKHQHLEEFTYAVTVNSPG